jgi:curved DNA-binding protein CbpA
MTRERRNLYRLLHVQPESPPEVIKAAYRVLMSTLRAHPDLGGDPALASQLNGAYAVLMDPAQRREYDRTLRRPPRGAPSGDAASASIFASGAAPPSAQRAGANPASSAATPPFSPGAWLAARRCPFCQTGFAARPALGARCLRCEGPLTPLPKPSHAYAAEVLGRRNGEPRFARDLAATLWLPGTPGAQAHSARLRDLSFNGFSLGTATPVPQGACVRVITEVFDALALVVARRRVQQRYALHAQLLTLELRRTATTGVYVNTQA